MRVGYLSGWLSSKLDSSAAGKRYGYFSFIMTGTFGNVTDGSAPCLGFLCTPKARLPGRESAEGKGQQGLLLKGYFCIFTVCFVICISENQEVLGCGRRGTNATRPLHGIQQSEKSEI